MVRFILQNIIRPTFLGVRRKPATKNAVMNVVNSDGPALVTIIRKIIVTTAVTTVRLLRLAMLVLLLLSGDQPASRLGV